MSITLLTPILILFVLALAVAFAVRGYKGGMTRALINFACAVASAFLSALLAMVIGMISGDIMLEDLQSRGVISFDLESMVFVQVAEIVAGMIFSAILFVPIFLCVFAVSKVVIAMVRESKQVHPEASEDTYLSENATFREKNDKCFGAIVGTLCGIFISIVIASPFTGVMRSIPGTLSVAQSLSADGGFKISDELYEAEDYSSDFMVVTLDALGGRTFFDLATTTVCYGELTNISTEIRVIENTNIADITSSLMRIAAFDKNSADRLDKLIELSERSVLLKVMILSGIQDMASSWLGGEDYYGVERPALPNNSVVNALTDEMLTFLASTTVSAMSDDVKIFVAFCNIANDYATVFENGEYNEVIDALVSGEVINKLTKGIKSNSRIESLERAIDNVIMRRLAEELNSRTSMVRETVFSKISEAFTDTAYISYSDSRVEVLAGKLGEIFSDVGMYAHTELMETVAERLVTYFGAGRSYVSYFEVKEFFGYGSKE